MSTIASHLPLNISETVRNRGLVPKGPSMGNGLYGDRVVTWQLTSCDPKMSRDPNMPSPISQIIYLNNC